MVPFFLLMKEQSMRLLNLSIKKKKKKEGKGKAEQIPSVGLIQKVTIPIRFRSEVISTANSGLLCYHRRKKKQHKEHASEK